PRFHRPHGHHPRRSAAGRPSRVVTGERVMALYEETAARRDAQGWIVGRRTLEEMGAPSGAPADVGPMSGR
ncbi:hypothetical protein, partial [Sagittula sp. S175]|uniref:hypothetical protein n=1 Tax=Sagittula sp. S175 TaxID=3415129 RepID=UPI003C7E0CA7